AKVEKDGFGVNIMPEDADILMNAITNLYEDKESCKIMGEKARKIAEEQFDRPKSYQKIEQLIRRLIDENEK
ncbi:MAG: glycosyltransferase WbuB, partial [Hespellia sp.]|nr:glycosyltransferase WbuB [Hespellia sp.]